MWMEVLEGIAWHCRRKYQNKYKWVYEGKRTKVGPAPRRASKLEVIVEQADVDSSDVGENEVEEPFLETADDLLQP
jgi:hypothetical protein